MLLTAATVSTFVQIGVQRDESYQQALERGATRIVLVEAESRRANELGLRHAGTPGFSVVQTAVSDRDGEGELYVFSLPEFNSLRPPTRLLELLPGLRNISRMSVPVLTPASLLDRIGRLDTPVHLVIDALGEELAILDGWKAADAIDAVDVLEVRCSAEPMYDRAPHVGEVCAWLEKEGFVLEASDDSDPDWPRLRLRRNPLALALTALRGELERELARSSELQDALRTAKAEAFGQAERVSLLIADADAASKARQAIEDRLSLVERALDDALVVAEQAAGAADTAARLVGEHERLTADYKALSDTATWRTSRIAELEAAAALQTGEIDALRQQAEMLTQRIAVLEAAAVETSAEHERLTADYKALSDTATWRTSRIAELEAVGAESEAHYAAERNAQQQAAFSAAAEASVRESAMKTEIATLEEKLAAAGADLRVAIRVQALAQADLRDVQMRYSEILEIRNQQETLLRRLRPTLEHAFSQIIAQPTSGESAKLIERQARDSND